MIETLKKLTLNPFFIRVLIVIGGTILILIITKIIKKVFTKHIKNKENKYKSQGFFNIFGYFLISVLILAVFNDSLSGISVALGVAGAGIAFALQEIIASVAGWVAIMFGAFYSIGDRVQVGGIKGDVIDIGILRTTLMEMGQWVDGDLYNGRVVKIANSFVFKEPVFNYTADFPFLWDEIKIQLNYGSDYHYAKATIQAVADSFLKEYALKAQDAWKIISGRYLIEPASTQPMISFAAKEGWAEYTLRYVVEYNKRRSMKDVLFSKIIEELQKSEGKVQFPVTTIQMLGK